MDTVNRTSGYTRSVLVAVGLIIAGFIAQTFASLPAVLVDPQVAEAPLETSYEVRALYLIPQFIGFVVVGGAYLQWTGRGLGFVDLSIPSLRQSIIGIVGVVGSIAFVMVAGVVIQVIGIEATSNQILQFVGEDPTMVLIMIVIVFLFNAPAEEFLFRGIIQKRLYEAFTKPQAIVVTSAIFGLVHVPIYLVSGQPLVGTFASILIVAGAAVIFGYLYAITDNLFVPIAAHAGYNAFQFGLLYLALKYGNEELIEEATSIVVTVLETGSILL